MNAPIRRGTAQRLTELAAEIRAQADRLMPIRDDSWSAAAREFLASQKPRPDVPGPMPYSPDGGNWLGGCKDTQGRRWVHVPHEGWRLDDRHPYL